MELKKPALNAKAFLLRLFSAAAAINAILLFVLVWALYQSHQHSHKAAQDKVLAISRFQEQGLADTIDKIDIILSSLSDEIVRQKINGGVADRPLRAFIEKQKSRSRELITLLFIDENGAIKCCSETKNSKQREYLSDRGYFRFHKKNTTHQTLVFKPHFGRVALEWVLPFSQRVSNPDGSFGGVVLATIRLAYIDWLFAIADVGTNGVIELRHKNLTVITRRPKLERIQHIIPSGAPQSKSEMFIHKHRQYGSFMERSPYDGIERIVSVRKIGRYPLYVRVGLSPDDYLTEWRTQCVFFSCLYAAFFLLTLLTSLKLKQNWKEHKEAEAQLQASHDFLSKLSTNILGVIFEFKMSPDGRFSISYISGALKEYYGMSPEEALGDATQLFSKMHPEDYDVLIDSIHESAHRMQAWTLEFRTLPFPNVMKWLYGTSKPEKSEDGSIVWRGFITDITERKQREQELRLASRVFTDIHEGVTITDADGSIIDVNEAFIHITGYTKEEVIGENPRILKSGRHTPEFYESLWQSLTGTGAWSDQIWNRRKSGEIYASLVSINAVRDSKGNIQNFVALYTDITPMKEYEQELMRLAHYDPLTGLLNRSLLEDRLRQAIAQCQRTKTIVAVAYIDLDGFKEVNDHFGHEAGDELLILIAQRIKNALREIDSLVRLGGDEFVAILTNLKHQQDCEQILTRMLHAIAEAAPVDSTVAYVSASIGATIYPDIDTDANLLVNHADQAMYEAKRAGKNCLHFYGSNELGAKQESD